MQEKVSNDEILNTLALIVELIDKYANKVGDQARIIKLLKAYYCLED